MGLFLMQTGNRLANLAHRTKHLLLLMLLMERKKEVAMTSAAIIHPSAPGHILVAAVSLSFQGFSIRWSWQWNHSHISAHGCPSSILSYPTETTYPHCKIIIKPVRLLLQADSPKLRNQSHLSAAKAVVIISILLTIIGSCEAKRSRYLMEARGICQYKEKTPRDHNYFACVVFKPHFQGFCDMDAGIKELTYSNIFLFSLFTHLQILKN